MIGVGPGWVCVLPAFAFAVQTVAAQDSETENLVLEEVIVTRPQLGLDTSPYHIALLVDESRQPSQNGRTQGQLSILGIIHEPFY